MVLSGAGAAVGDWAPEEPLDRGQGRATHTHIPHSPLGGCWDIAASHVAGGMPRAMQCGLVVSLQCGRSSAS